MSVREALSAAAMLGATPVFEPEGSPLDPLLAGLARRETPQRTLDAIALVTAYQEAGRLAAPPVILPEPCAPDPRPLCGAVAAGILRELLSDPKGLLPEWLSLLNQAHRRPPEELLPQLLDAAARERSLQPPTAAAAGPLGPWLARFRPEWSWTNPAATDAATWETGTLPERLAYLRQVRATAPGRARSLLEQTWTADPADTRRQFVEALSDGLSPDDEPFLETCLDDRSVVVRRAASDLLAALPDSALCRRMAERLAGRLRLARTGLLRRKLVLELDPFDTLDPAMARDGVEKKPPAGARFGERGWWTIQVLGCVPPQRWVDELGAEPAALLEAAANGEWPEVLVPGWRDAAIRYRSAPWLRAFAGVAQPGAPELRAVFLAMEAAARESAMAELIHQTPTVWLRLAPEWCPHPWSRPFSGAVLKAIRAHMVPAPDDPAAWIVKPLLRQAALLVSMDVESLPEDEWWAEFTALLRYRRRMRKALQNQEDR